MIDVQVRRDEHFAFCKHVNHVLIGLPEAIERDLKSVEAAFKTFYESCLAYVGQ